MKKQSYGFLRLTFAVAIIFCVWIYLLPALGELKSVQTRIEKNRAAGINPTAVFYTDHPAMVDIERKIEDRVYSDSGAFWKPSN